MKAFNKWAEENFCTEDDCWNDWDDGYHAGIKAGWKAALQEVLKHTDRYICQATTEIRNWIDGELEE